MVNLEITSVRRPRDMRAFIDLPWRLYKETPHWIPPVKRRVSRLLDPKKHPFWRFSERRLFLAKRGTDVVGRIAAIVDGNYNRFHEQKMGIWGFFECARDPEAAMALFSAAEGWVRKKGMSFIRGPLNPSTNYEVGLLIQGFDAPPTLMMTYNLPYYPELVRLCGFCKEKDLYAFLLEKGYEPPKWTISLADRVAKREEITIKKSVKKNLKAELALMNRAYNEFLAGNWGFVPMTESEFKETARDIVHILDRDLVFFLQHKDELAGVCLILPDINPLMKRFNGRLGLGALIKKHLYWSDVTGLRGIMFGVKEKYRQTGVPLVAFHHLYRVLKDHKQYRYLELGWTLEDNEDMNRLYQEGSLKPYKRYRIYRKDL